MQCPSPHNRIGPAVRSTIFDQANSEVESDEIMTLQNPALA